MNLDYVKTEPNIYFIKDDSYVILYSNLSKSGLYTYPVAEIKKVRGKLLVNITSNMAVSDESVKELLIVKIKINELPQKIEASFLGQKITDYKVIELNNN